LLVRLAVCRIWRGPRPAPSTKMSLAILVYVGCAVLVSVLLVGLCGVRLLSVICVSCCGSRVLYRMPVVGRRKRVALTIDDVPFFQDTCIADILNVLVQANAPATLLMLGEALRTCTPSVRDILRRALASGTLSMANHGHSESAHWRLTDAALSTEVRACEAAVAEVLNPHTLLPFYRPGHGFFTRHGEAAVTACGYRLLLGDVYPHDPHITCVWLLWLMTLLSVRDGSIVILHDRPHTAHLLRWLLPSLRWWGYDIVPLDCVVDA
jgi:peptidoglycan/xylan/chitin deacetylase (PgdA/CDA1 family)